MGQIDLDRPSSSLNNSKTRILFKAVNLFEHCITSFKDVNGVNAILKPVELVRSIFYKLK